MKPKAGERAVQVIVALLKSSCYLGLFLGMQVLVMLPVAVAAGIQQAIGEQEAGDQLFQALVDNAMLFSLISGGLTIVAVLAFYLIRRKKLSEALWLRRVDAASLWAGASLAPALYLIVILVMAALPEAWMESYNEASSGIASGGAATLIATVLVAPVVEEFIFRGLIMSRLSKAMPGWLAVLLSAAIFGICHGHPVWFCYTFVLGAFFGFADLRTGSIWPSILAHLTFNAIGQAFTLAPESEAGTLITLGVVLLAGIAAPILDRKGISGLFRPVPRVQAVPALPMVPGVYEFDPWEE